LQTKNKLITSREMHALEVNVEYYGVSMLQLMENAGSGIAREVAARVPVGRRVAVFGGLGINDAAGDFAASELGFNLVATDLADWIPNVFDDR